MSALASITVQGSGVQGPKPLFGGSLAIVLAFALTLILPAIGRAQSTDPVARAQAAEAAMKEGRFEEAAGIYRTLVDGSPQQAEVLTNLGVALVMGGHPSDALDPLERAVALKPDLLTAQLYLSATYLALRQPEKAIAPMERVVAARPADVDSRRRLADAYAAAGRRVDAAAALRKVTELAPRLPAGWYALGQAYNDIKDEAAASFAERSEDAPWRQLLAADGLLRTGHDTDAFALYRAVLEQIPSMVSIHDSVARIYERTKHPAWAARERAAGVLTAAQCARRKPLCEFRAGRYRSAFAASLAGSDPESRYWRARAAAELSVEAFTHLDTLPDSAERRSVRAAVARAEERHTDAVKELEAALRFAPGDPELLYELASAHFASQNFEQAIATLAPLLGAHPDDPRLLNITGAALVRLRRLDEALPLLERSVERDPSDAQARLALGRAYLQQGNFAAAVPLLEARLADDQDGSLHLQLGRAYTGLGQADKAAPLLERAQALQRSAEERRAAAAGRSITPPK
jgi:tetratricopeptide (TPR) repeat protein